MPDPIKNILQNIIASSSSSTCPPWHITILSEWPQIVGALHTHTRVEKIQDSTLIIGVFHASWLQELYLLTPMLIKTINDYLKVPHITHIKCKAAARSLSKHKTPEEAKQNLPANPMTKVSLAQRQLSQRERQTLEKVEDPELRSMLETLLYITGGTQPCGKKK